jgi:ADP-dependent NAD(P)H-hydrate dehydratase
MPDPVEVTAEALRQWPLPAPGPDKEQRGRVLVVGGSRGTPGAVLLAGEAALRSGGGKLRIGTVRSTARQLAIALPEARVAGLPEDDEGNLTADAAAGVLDIAEGCGTVLLGPGLVEPAPAAALLAAVLPALDATVVLDGLATAFVTEAPERLRDLRCHFVLTVNPGELAHVLGADRSVVEEDPVAAARAAAERTGAVVVCGGQGKAVAGGSGTWRIPVGGEGLAVSGSGDVQAGIVAGLLARGADPAQAAVWGGYLHGRSGERLADRVHDVGFLARDVVAEVPHVLAEVAGAG